jgi:hypothetical protein
MWIFLMNYCVLKLVNFLTFLQILWFQNFLIYGFLMTEMPTNKAY